MMIPIRDAMFVDEKRVRLSHSIFDAIPKSAHTHHNLFVGCILTLMMRAVGESHAVRGRPFQGFNGEKCTDTLIRKTLLHVVCSHHYRTT